MFKIEMYATHERQIILNFRRNCTLDTFLNMYLIFVRILTGLRSVDLKGANVATSRKTRNSAETLFFLTPITVCLVSFVLLKLTYYLDYFVSFIYSLKTAMKYSNNLDLFLLRDEINIKINFKTRYIVV